MISIIAVIGKNNELGKDNNLIWYIPKDLKYFKEVTSNHTIIMGRKTFDSIGILPNRKHIVLTNRKEIDGVEVSSSVEELISKYNDNDEEVFVIGGESVYRQFIDFAKLMHLTEVDLECLDADTYFPAFNKDEWDSIEVNNHMQEDIPYKTLVYRRKK